MKQDMGNGILCKKMPCIRENGKNIMRPSCTYRLGKKYYINSKRRDRFGSSNIGQLITRETYK